MNNTIDTFLSTYHDNGGGFKRAHHEIQRYLWKNNLPRKYDRREFEASILAIRSKERKQKAMERAKSDEYMISMIKSHEASY